MRPLHASASMSPMVLPHLHSRTRRPFISTLHRRRIPPPHPHSFTSRALLLQAVDIPAETACLVCCHNPWPNEDIYFCPEEGLPTFVSGDACSLPVDPRCGSRSTTTALNLYTYIPGKPWAPWKSLPSLTRHRHQPLPVHITRLLSPRTCHPPSSSS